MTKRQPIDVQGMAESQILIQPDGRVFVLGTSRELLELLRSLQPQDQNLKRRIWRVAELERGTK